MSWSWAIGAKIVRALDFINEHVPGKLVFEAVVAPGGSSPSMDSSRSLVVVSDTQAFGIKNLLLQFLVLQEVDLEMGQDVIIGTGRTLSSKRRFARRSSRPTQRAQHTFAFIPLFSFPLLQSARHNQ